MLAYSTKHTRSAKKRLMCLLRIQRRFTGAAKYPLICRETLTPIKSTQAPRGVGDWSERLATGRVHRGKQPPSTKPPIRKLITSLQPSAVIAQTAPSVSTKTQTMCEAKILTGLPSPSVSISEIYKQNVYDSANNKIGDVEDILLSSDGRATPLITLIIDVGGFLGMGEKERCGSVQCAQANNEEHKTYSPLDATKDALKSAPRFKYGRWKIDLDARYTERIGTNPKKRLLSSNVCCAMAGHSSMRDGN
jgi:hypothetical protein